MTDKEMANQAREAQGRYIFLCNRLRERGYTRNDEGKFERTNKEVI